MSMLNVSLEYQISVGISREAFLSSFLWMDEFALLLLVLLASYNIYINLLYMFDEGPFFFFALLWHLLHLLWERITVGTSLDSLIFNWR